MDRSAAICHQEAPVRPPLKSPAPLERDFLIPSGCEAACIPLPGRPSPAGSRMLNPIYREGSAMRGQKARSGNSRSGLFPHVSLLSGGDEGPEGDAPSHYSSRVLLDASTDASAPFRMFSRRRSTNSKVKPPGNTLLTSKAAMTPTAVSKMRFRA